MALPRQHSLSMLGAEHGIFPYFNGDMPSHAARSGFTALEKRNIASESWVTLPCFCSLWECPGQGAGTSRHCAIPLSHVCQLVMDERACALGIVLWEWHCPFIKGGGCIVLPSKLEMQKEYLCGEDLSEFSIPPQYQFSILLLFL